MNMHARSTVLVLGLLALVAVLSPARATGQGRGARPLFLALPQSFPDVDARVVIMREPGRDLVILNERDAEPETLHAALRVLERMERDHPLSGDRGQIIPVTGFVRRRDLDPERRSELTAVLDDLRERPLANVGNLGLGHWIRYDAD